MKRVFIIKRYAAALALCLLLTAAFPVYSAEPARIQNSTYNVDVDIAWGEMDFIYTEGYLAWNPDTHAYDVPVEAEWTVRGNDITVKNVGSNGILARLEAKSNVETVTVGFKTSGNAQTSETTHQMVLAGASGNATPSSTVYFDVSGTISESHAALATVTITIIAE